MSIWGDTQPANVAAANTKEAPWAKDGSHDIIRGLLLVLAVVLVYLPVRTAGYVWDDDIYITANRAIIGPQGLKEIWTTGAADISPLATTTFWLEHALWGVAPGPFHLVNVFVHASCAVALWRVLRILDVPGAWMGAALWALHPIAVESVAWVSELKNPESGLFFLLSIFFFVRWLQPVDSKDRSTPRWAYGLAILFAVLAMAAKSSTVILPAVLCLCAWWLERRWRWRNVLIVVPFVLLSTVTSLWSIRFEKASIALTGDHFWVRTWPERLVTAGDAIWFYLGKLIWPSPLMAVYRGWNIDAGDAISYLPLMGFLMALFLLWLRRDSWGRPWFFCFAYFLVALLPVLGFSENTIFHYSLVFDHFQYLAAMGPLALAGAGLARLVDLYFPKQPRPQAIIGAGLLLVLGVLSWHRTWVYQSQETLWTDALAKNPAAWGGWLNLGTALVEEGKLDEGLADFDMAVKLNPLFAQAHSNIGNGFALKGQTEKAISEYREALRLNPADVGTHNSLGSIWLRKGDLDKASAEFQNALAVDPANSVAHYSLGRVLDEKGKPDLAIPQYRAAVASDPRNALAAGALGDDLALAGQKDEALTEYQTALEINPSDLQTRNSLAVALFKKGELDAAMDQFKQLLAANANDAAGHNGLGIVLAQKGELAAAMAEFQEAVRLKPDFTGAQNNLAKSEAMIHQGASGSH